jgi:hypothetical protein
MAHPDRRQHRLCYEVSPSTTQCLVYVLKSREQRKMDRTIRDFRSRTLHNSRSVGQVRRLANALRASSLSPIFLLPSTKSTFNCQRVYIRHWIARGVCLIILPFMIYAFCFKLHFLILNRSGPGDAQMSSLFQAHLHGNDFGRNPLGAFHRPLSTNLE